MDALHQFGGLCRLPQVLEDGNSPSKAADKKTNQTPSTKTTPSKDPGEATGTTTATGGKKIKSSATIKAPSNDTDEATCNTRVVARGLFACSVGPSSVIEPQEGVFGLWSWCGCLLATPRIGMLFRTVLRSGRKDFEEK